MESQRSFILIGLALVSFLLWQEWQTTYGPQPVVTAEQQVELPNNAVASATGPQPLGQEVTQQVQMYPRNYKHKQKLYHW